MTDSGRHFNNNNVQEWCIQNNVDFQVVPAYAPWVNGLVENANKLFLGSLKRACAPGLGKDDYNNVKEDDIPRCWPDHFSKTVLDLNWRILPAFKFGPCKLLLGYVINTHSTPISDSITDLMPSDVDTQMAYIDQQRFDGFAHTVEHASKHKIAFDRKVTDHTLGEVIFAHGDLVQIYANEWDFTFRTECKLVPRWSAPQRIVARRQTSYSLETLEGFPIVGWFHTRHLCCFVPRTGMELARLQNELEIRLWEEGSSLQDHNTNRLVEDTGSLEGPQEHLTRTVTLEGGGHVTGESEQEEGCQES